MTEDLYPTRASGRPSLIDRADPVVYGTAADGPLTADDLARFDTAGFHAFDQLIEPGEVAAFHTELQRLREDPALKDDERTVFEPTSRHLRSVFEVHKVSEVFARLLHDPRVVGPARQILGSEVYIHQSRVNFKPGLAGNTFYWHSDFETWHAEDGMPRMRAVSLSIAITENLDSNGPLMIMPGSHRTFVTCPGETPENHYLSSLRSQEVGTPDPDSLRKLGDEHGIRQFTGAPGSATMFDCNSMHGSNSNITPFPRSNVFVVFNSVENTLVEPFGAASLRPPFIAAREFTPVR
ncbi:ectoine hydroxylase [Actinomadura graeca]|uniref:Ectoine hydroxylase n=1 Tax=Actinomadura graeca TaxID=2750812 RepID=A0ABX8QYW7_9ACTN|nr:ectoine hydroxylase [Actinomadura graeca]QXJ22632.1 ectoine hydroxylase [Actinomadura graeca]